MNEMIEHRLVPNLDEIARLQCRLPPMRAKRA